MKIMLVSNAPWATTGYGTQTAQLALRLKAAGHDVALLAFYGLEGGIGAWEDMTVYPTDHTRLGKYMLRKYVEDHGAGEPVQVITLMDVWTWIDPRFGGVADFKGLDIAAWTPVDHDPCPPKVAGALQTFDAKAIAMSQFGQRALADMEIEATYAPHAIDVDILRPLRDQGLALKEAMGLPADAFVVGMVANNQGVGPPRKAFPQVFQAFAEFARRHDDAYLYMHSDVFGFQDGLNLLPLAQISGIPESRFCAVGQDKYMAGTITQQQMARIYSMLDVLANPSYGEGFGIPIIEAQACGTPVIVTDWTAMGELVGAGWKVQGDRWYNSAHGAYWMCPSVYEIVEALEAARNARDSEPLREEARSFALGYSADLIFASHWQPILQSLEAQLGSAAEEIPAQERLNRAARRAKSKSRAKA